MKEATRYLTPERGRGSFFISSSSLRRFSSPGRTRAQKYDDTEEDKQNIVTYRSRKDGIASAEERERETDYIYSYPVATHFFF